jgi:hypothetical protein
MNAILSVNCVFICALQRLLGDTFFVLVLRSLYSAFTLVHPIATGVQVSDSVSVDNAKDRVKNLVNTFMHFFIFQGITQTLVYDLILKHHMASFREADIETLIFLLHNIGL